MKNIYWTVHELEPNIFVSIAIVLLEDENHAIIMGENFDTYNRKWNSKKEAIHFVTETQKPFYYQVYGSRYELIYMEPNSKEFVDMMEKTITTINEGIDLLTPWYIKLWEKIKGAF